MDKVLNYLDELQGEGIVNPHGAIPHLKVKFDLTQDEANEIVENWIESKEK